MAGRDRGGPLKLFHVQDNERPMYVVAKSFGDAFDRWAQHIAGENDCAPEDLEPPSGVSFVCDADDLLWPAFAETTPDRRDALHRVADRLRSLAKSAEMAGGSAGLQDAYLTGAILCDEEREGRL